MAIATTAPIEQRLAGMAAEIRQRVPAAEMRLFGSLVHKALREGVLLHGHS
jgi:predicted nucleotidyltransferase